MKIFTNYYAISILCVGIMVSQYSHTAVASPHSISTLPDTPHTKKFPNIIYILADDLGYGDIRAYNPASHIPTPHLDQLASSGMMFTDAHSPSSVCTPTRYGILTGRYCWRSKLPRGVLRGYGRALLEQNQMTVAQLLKDHGYRTGVVGKWHLGLDWVIKEGHASALASDESEVNSLGMVSDMHPRHIDFTQKPTDGPLDHGFHYSFILPASLDMEPYCYLENDVLTELPSDSTSGNDLNTGYTEAFWRAGKMAPSFTFEEVLPTFVSKALGFIGNDSPAASGVSLPPADAPFFLYLPFAAPHTPWVPKDDYAQQSSAGNYGDFVHMVDDMVGRILKKLDDMNVAEETLVIFTSDNGPFWTPELIETYDHRAAGVLRGMKADAWEGGHRVPFIVQWPGRVEAGSQSDALTCLTNLFQTTSDIIGVDMEQSEAIDSYSILPILLGEADEVIGQRAVVHHSSRAFFAIRQGDWKLIEGRGSGGFSEPTIYEPKEGEVPGQLYHLKKDPMETHNVYADEPEKVEELKALLGEIKKMK